MEILGVLFIIFLPFILFYSIMILAYLRLMNFDLRFRYKFQDKVKKKEDWWRIIQQ